MARVHFELIRRFQAPVRHVWAELVDWPGHGAWIPATTVEAEPGDPTAVGYTFTAWTGVRPIALEDRMRVTRCDWDEAAATGICDVESSARSSVDRPGSRFVPMEPARCWCGAKMSRCRTCPVSWPRSLRSPGESVSGSSLRGLDKVLARS